MLGVGIFLWWAASEGGYAPTAWYPGALLFLALLLAAAASHAGRTTLQRPTAVALVLLAGFAIWSFLSIGWADVKGDAWDGANRTLLYASVYAVFALPRWRPAQAAILVALFAVGVAAIGLTALALDGTSAFIGQRLASPIEYPNANAALFLAACWSAVALAARAEVHWLARGFLLAAAGVSLQLSILAQSRASLVAGPAALALYLLLSPERLRALLALVPVAVVTLVSLGPLLDVYASSSGGEFESAVARERRTLVLAAVILLVTGLLLGGLDRRRNRRARAPWDRRRLLAFGGAVTGALVVALVAGSAILGVQRPPNGADQEGGSRSALELSRFTGGLESGRYDAWRVALGEFARHPFLGAGVDNFAVDYARERRTHEEPLYPHSLLLRPASQTGLVGAALFLGFLAAAAVAALRARMQHDPLARAVASVGVVVTAYWLVHGSVDWLWEIPALTGPALASLGLASALAAAPSTRRHRARSLRRAPVAAAVTAAALLAAASYALPGLAAFQVERAIRAWPKEPDRAFSRLERARRLNVLSERPDLIAGVLARRAGQPARARDSFARALERNPHDWYLHIRLALLTAGAGQRGEAFAHLRRARALNPAARAVDSAEEAVLAGRAGDRQLLERLDRLALRSPLGRRPPTCRPVLGIGARCTNQLGPLA